ncbi:rhamnogalacturonan acetylesterase [Bacillus haynesii]|uniref:rhamnogalacturonan acetylesterase n=1 Tax=Bacillus haynesii TaxID=1925021 RepID=UPI00227DDC29|nr:rhamnogalacturonan acetylesterase [Bacillus haynesii]MCY8092585.1 rhamnogalacturonan acetylesterase [Bacillus haynesii]MCY8292577.1 rhamnogalacturonan acetylesterase [Bacillus haynesii]MCY8408273.1 rhamnogalacturonan acetylesterase [Bacillus haynesii]MCY8432017.1 rhamnogalacturonan acetylesterase [Bacillus haynesii]MCY8612152.1 rhamnogalacturonan acetylesterase [Bacillus haynesii]
MMQDIQLFLAGDSTVCDYDGGRAPRAGWGQKIDAFLSDGVLIRNEAASGRSSRSFIEEGRLERIMTQIRSGDYLFVQFGHNDQKLDDRYTEPYTTYKQHLRRYIDDARLKKANPVLITPVQRRSFESDGRFKNTHGDYPDAMIQLAEELRVPLIDLAFKSRQLLESMGQEASKKLFLWLEPGEHPNYPDGARDDTHFCDFGANEIAKLVAQGIKEAGIPL